jgi:ABC-type transport system involved in multi-copper enzyme maturation permease subunit
VTPFPRTVLVEVQRGFARRLVRVTALIFVAAFLLGAFINFRVDSSPPPEDEQVLVGSDEDPSPYALDLVELWPEGGDEALLGLPALFLVMAALLFGASFVGAEWRAGTVTTNLTWEPRRVRLAMAKFLGAGIVAFCFSVVLQAVFVLVLLPNIATNGSFEGADADWWLEFGSGLWRGALLAGLAAIGAAVLAMIGRNTTVAIAVGFVIVSILEPILRAWKPWTDQWLLTTNAGNLYIADGVPLADGTVLTQGRSTVVTLAYLAALVLLATWLFARRDVAAAT